MILLLLSFTVLVGIAASNTTSTTTSAYQCDFNSTDEECYCTADTCMNGGSCENTTDGVGYLCTCDLGWTGTRCEIREYFTLQQWLGDECIGVPWRCFRLQVGLCVDTGKKDGIAGGPQENWYGSLTWANDGGGDGLFNVGLCWGEDPEDPEEQCTCRNFYANIPRLGKNSFGPTTAVRNFEDSDRCHKLGGITASRLVRSTGDVHDGIENMNCHAVHESMAVLMILALLRGLFE